MSKEAMKLALEALEICAVRQEHLWHGLQKLSMAKNALQAALAKPDFWEGYVPEPVKPAQQALDKKAENARELGLDYEPAQNNPLDCGVYLGSGKDHAIKHHVSYGPAQQEPVAWKLVPREPTHEMLKAMDECSKEGYDERLYAGHAASVYMAAVDAAPTPPAQRKPLTDKQQIAEALRRHGLTLVKTTHGYDVMNIKQITAHGIKENT